MFDNHGNRKRNVRIDRHGYDLTRAGLLRHAGQGHVPAYFILYREGVGVFAW